MHQTVEQQVNFKFFMFRSWKGINILMCVMCIQEMHDSNFTRYNGIVNFVFPCRAPFQRRITRQPKMMNRTKGKS